MIVWDVQILVHAFRSDSPFHARSRRLIADSVDRGDSYLVSPAIAASFVRIVTDGRLFASPSSVDEAWRFLDFLEADPLARVVVVDSQTYSIFKHLALVTSAQGTAVSQALLAAIAIKNGARFITGDTTFSRFPGLDIETVELAAAESRQ